MSLASVEHVQDILDQRAGVRLHAAWGHISLLLGGGHICELIVQSRPNLNPLWRPPWRTIDPGLYSPSDHAQTFGPPPDGRLLAGIAGHSLSFDHFGPPSPEEVAAGLNTHGEAPAAQWKILQEFERADPEVEMGVQLPVAQIEFRRMVRIDGSHPVIYCEEKARNLAAMDRPISWNEHVTIGPPFLEAGSTLIDIPATRSQVISASYSDAMMLAPDAEFLWPHAPLQQGGIHDLRTTPDGVYERYTAQLLDPTHELGYVAISNPGAGLMLVYLFRRSNFPWVGNWEERFHRKAPPWVGNTFCRGLEFSTTPFAIPRRETIAQGPLFKESTYRWLPALSEVKVRYLMLLLEIPFGFAGVEDVSFEGEQVTVRERGSMRILSIPADGSFLAGEVNRPR
jgi:hypothetical protein